MVIRRGEIWWADLGEPRGSEAGYQRPIIIIQDDALNRSRLATVVVIPLTSNLQFSKLGTNIVISKKETALDKDSVAQMHLLQALPRERLLARIGEVQINTMEKIEVALLQTLGLFE